MKVLIESVEIVKGHTIEVYWENYMQKVYTNKGIYIDYMTDKYYLMKGYNWGSVIGKTMDVVISKSEGFTWIFPEKTKVFEDCELSFMCPLKWDDLEKTNMDNVRFCKQCMEHVYQVQSSSGFKTIAKENKCVNIKNEDLIDLQLTGRPSFE